MLPEAHLDTKGQPERTQEVAGSTPEPSYEPPAIAWEEAFEPLAATSCGLTVPFEPSCLARPQV
jgi:hypothetical protein